MADLIFDVASGLIKNVAAPILGSDAANKTYVDAQITSIVTGELSYFKANSSGTAALATGTDAIAIGEDSTATNSNAVGIGKTATASNTNSISIGTNSSATGTNAIAIGNNTTASTNDVILAYQSNKITPTGAGSGRVSIGPNAGGTGSGGTINIGATGKQILIGQQAHASLTASATNTQGEGVIAIGYLAAYSDSGNVTTGDRAIIIGCDAGRISTGVNVGGGAIIIGNAAGQTVDPATDSVAIGTSSSAIGTYGVALGARSDATGISSIAIGGASSDANSADATENYAIAIGYNSSASAINAIAIGPNVSNSTADTVQIGTSATNYFVMNSQGHLVIKGGGIELGDQSGVSSTPFIDFHSGATVVNYDARIIVSGGTGINGGATLKIESTLVETTSTIQPSVDNTYNLGSPSFRWATVYGVATSSLYADLAERYEADEELEPGTVVIFGGEKEITASVEEFDTRVAGVISTVPAFRMNDSVGNDITHPYVALKGKVPCKVIGKVNKGDLLVTSSTKGHAMSIGKMAKPYTAFARSIENFDGNCGVILVSVI